MKKLNIAFLVHGRFHMFDLAREIASLGHNIKLFTNYPAVVVKRFGVEPHHVVSFLSHGITTRVLGYPPFRYFSASFEPKVNRWFGAWAKSAVKSHEPPEGWDAILCMSGVAEETFSFYQARHTLCVLHRGSTHIKDQWDILETEEKRTGTFVEKPSPWIIQREEREYQLADLIRVQSPFAYQGFLKMGIPDSKVDLIPLGVSRAKFSATPEQIKDRIQRIQDGKPLRILGTGTFCLRKGAWDLAELLKLLPADRFKFRFVGKVAEDAQAIAKNLSHRAEFVPKVPQDELPGQYAWGDLFLLPSLEDGFAVVVTQALSCALPTLVTQNTGSSLFVKDDINGWVFPIRSPKLIAEKLEFLDRNRPQLIQMIQTMNQLNPPGTWEDTAKMTVEDISERSSLKKAMVSMGN